MKFFFVSAVHLCRHIRSRPDPPPQSDLRHVKLLLDLYADSFDGTQRISVGGIYLGISNLPGFRRIKVSEAMPCAFESKGGEGLFSNSENDVDVFF